MKITLISLFFAAALATASAQTTEQAPPKNPAPQQESQAKADEKIAPADAPAAALPAPAPQSGATDGLRLNFRGVPLDMVLNYLSDAAGFTIVLETEVKGKVDVWSNHPLNQDEALALLNQVLNKNGYAAIRNGKTLTVVSREEAKKRDIPVKSGYNPTAIPKNEEIVTQIIPVRYINATQLIKDLQPLLPAQASLTANESGNALVITDTQSSIRRMAEIVNALDTSVSSISTIKVFALRYADAKALATTVKELFAQDTSRNSDGRRSRDFGGFFGGGRGEGDRGSSSSSSEGRGRSVQVTAVADERSNSLVVGAPADFMPLIEDLVKSVDTNVEDVTELRVFRLKYADPVEMADILTSLFPDDSRASDNNNRGGPRFSDRFPFSGFFGNRGGNDRQTSASGESDRLKKQGRVLAVADARTGSVIVTAARDLMVQIEQMIEQLDANPAKKQKVFVYSLENADAQEVESVLKNLFETQNSRGTTRSGVTQNSPLTTRSQQNQNTTTGNGLGGNFGGAGVSDVFGGGAPR